MLRAETVPCPHDAALQDGERGLNRIGMGVAIDVDMEPAANRLVRWHAAH
jgi:hypothetical protein